ncbi:hypothetical protein CerSpe_005400 [Prunus speciosa]
MEKESNIPSNICQPYTLIRLTVCNVNMMTGPLYTLTLICPQLTFSPALSREFRPYKPDPAPLLHICSAWEVKPSEIMMVGDSLKDDVACGKRAGAVACLLDESGRYDSPEYANVDFKPDFKVSSLMEVHSLLEAHFDLSP